MRCGGGSEPARGGRHVWRGGDPDRHDADDARGPRTTVTRPGGCRRCAGAAAAARRGAARSHHGQCGPAHAVGDAAADAVADAATRTAGDAATRTDAAAGDAVGPAGRWGGGSRRTGRRTAGTAAAAQPDDAARAPTRRWTADATARTRRWHGWGHAGERHCDAAAIVSAAERQPRRTERVAAIAAQRDQPPAHAAFSWSAHSRPHPAGTAAGTGHDPAGTGSAAAHHAAHAVGARPADDAAVSGTGQSGRITAADLSDAAGGGFPPAARRRCRAAARRGARHGRPSRIRRQPDKALLSPGQRLHDTAEPVVSTRRPGSSGRPGAGCRRAARWLCHAARARRRTARRG